EHVRVALPVLQRLGASDDEIQLRSVLVSCAIAEGRLAEAAAELDRINTAAGSGTGFGGMVSMLVGRAGLLLARGDYPSGLAAYREGAAAMRELAVPGIPRTGQGPRALLCASMALTAHDFCEEEAEEVYGQELFRACRENALRLLRAADTDLDYPVTGIVLFALGAWALLRRAAPAQDAVRLLVLADRFAY